MADEGGRPSFKQNQSQLSDDGDYNVSEERYVTGQEVQLSRNNNSDSPQSQEYNTEEVDMNTPDEDLPGRKQMNDNNSGHAANNSGDNHMEGGDHLPYGSDLSSAEKYADRNSDPGVHCSERELLPVLPGGQYTMEGGLYDDGAAAMGGGNMGGMGGDMIGPTNAAGGVVPGMTTGGGVAGGGGGAPTGNESVSLGTATQTHEVRMPMLLSTFKPATGCTNASDFIVRCFVARLRSGITVVKHGRSRWCKSRLRVLHVHSDGRSLSWKPALGEPSSGKRPPKLDLTTCREVRHAWSPDPDNPMFTGTPILRQKCEAANAHKSFALIFPKRTVDITAVTADQCKVLMEGFSALCFRLHVAQKVAGGEGKSGGNGGTMGESTNNEEQRATVSVTASNISEKRSSPKYGKKRG
eukprot:scaffold10628_cov131-Skeletonema_menzelii.AAC.6